METFYLIDFENVHNKGLENIDSLTKHEHEHIFSTENALNIRMDIVFSKGIDMKGHIVPVKKQSLDMHLVSYLGYLLGIHGKQCAYVIVSKDTDYDNIIKFWKEEGYPCINANRICKFVIAHCNDEKMLSRIHNDLKKEYDDYLQIYEDVKTILGKFVLSKNKFKRESQVRSFFGQHFKKKIYIDNKEEIIRIILNAKTRQQINDNLMKLYADGKVVKHIYQTIRPFTKDLPGK